MAKNSICEKVTLILDDFLAENNFELYDVKYVKEGKDKFLRVFIDKDLEDEYVSTTDCEKVSRYLSEKLDEQDFIPDNYYLEVSSPGMDRELFREKDFVKYSGKDVDVSLYKGVDGKKKFRGKLLGLVNNSIVIEDENGKEISFPREQIAKVNLAVKF